MKTLIDLDEGLLAQAKEILQTSTKKDTVNAALAEHRGQMRAVGLPDLLVAAVAERHRVTVLHYDKAFDLIAAVTGQPTTWVVAPGSVP